MPRGRSINLRYCFVNLSVPETADEYYNINSVELYSGFLVDLQYYLHVRSSLTENNDVKLFVNQT